MQTVTTTETIDLSGLPRATLRRWVRGGIISPQRRGLRVKGQGDLFSYRTAYALILAAPIAKNDRPRLTAIKRVVDVLLREFPDDAAFDRWAFETTDMPYEDPPADEQAEHGPDMYAAETAAKTRVQREQAEARQRDALLAQAGPMTREVAERLYRLASMYCERHPRPTAMTNDELMQVLVDSWKQAEQQPSEPAPNRTANVRQNESVK